MRERETYLAAGGGTGCKETREKREVKRVTWKPPTGSTSCITGAGPARCVALAAGVKAAGVEEDTEGLADWLVPDASADGLVVSELAGADWLVAEQSVSDWLVAEPSVADLLIAEPPVVDRLIVEPSVADWLIPEPSVVEGLDSESALDWFPVFESSAEPWTRYRIIYTEALQ